MWMSRLGHRLDQAEAWIMSEKPYDQYEQISVLERELAKQIMVALC
jgi:hypothetical protein